MITQRFHQRCNKLRLYIAIVITAIAYTCIGIRHNDFTIPFFQDKKSIAVQKETVATKGEEDTRTNEENTPRTSTTTAKVTIQQVKNEPTVGLPNLLLIGSMKGGSTAVSVWLVKQGVCNGEVFAGEPQYYAKEMTFFDNPDRYSRGKLFYTKHYEHCTKKNATWIMDATPGTVLHPDKVYDTYKDEPNLRDLKIIFTIREPISRELSMYNHYRLIHSRNPHNVTLDWLNYFMTNPDDGSTRTFPDFVENVTLAKLNITKSQSSIAHYAMHLKRWFSLFDPTQILLLSYEHEIKPGAPAKQRIQQFLDDDTSFSPEALAGPFPTANTGDDSKFKVSHINCSVVERLRPFLDEFHKELYDLLATTPRPPMEIRPWPEFDHPPKCVG